MTNLVAYDNPMRALNAIRSEKRVTDAGTWHNGKIPRSAFPLSHVKQFHRLGKAWHWSVCRANDGQHNYRVLVAFEPAKRQYWAWLGAEFGDDQAVIARVEFHATHDGWHCHWKTGDIKEVPRGSVKAAWPVERKRLCHGEPRDISKSDALGIACRLFNISGGPVEGEMLL